MFEAYFKKPTIIHSQNVLQNEFKSDQIYLGSNSEIKLNGRIKLNPNILFSGQICIGDNCVVESFCHLTDVEVAQNSVIRSNSVIIKAKLGNNNIIGPFCFIRDDCIVENSCIVGSHVELVRSHLKCGVKISHQAFVADTYLYDNVIIGAGTVFCNYDGEQKQSSVIETGVTVGSGTMIVSPVRIGEYTVIGAGSVITKNIKSNTVIIQKRK
jgi:bifunctional UDP-N-acetylglucosamine pyrophosphorylase/glucosamine-1-phosphate N-acetyltransferase